MTGILSIRRHNQVATFLADLIEIDMFSRNQIKTFFFIFAILFLL